jgi:hypothetical protein
VSLSRPVRLILVLATLALSLFACKPNDQEAVAVKSSGARPVHKRVGPPERQNSKFAPIVDVYVDDNKRAVPDLEPIPVHARAGHAHGGEPVPSVIIWFGPPTKTLKIEMKEATQPCLKEPPTCQGNHCIGFTNVNFNNSTPAPCGYKVWIQDVTLPYDPVVIIDDCCAN